MGQLEKARAANGKAKRGSVDNDKRLASLAGAAVKGAADWGSLRPEWLAAVVVLVSSAGGAVRFGLSRDKGSYSVGLYLGDETQTIWFNGDADLEQEFQALYAKLQVIVGE